MSHIPPHDEACEQEILGSIFIDNDVLAKLGDLNPQDFYHDQNAAIFQSCLKLHTQGEEVNQITVAHDLNKLGKLDIVGGPAYLLGLLMMVPTLADFPTCVKRVRDTSLCRRLLAGANEIQHLAYEENGDAAIALAKRLSQLGGSKEGMDGRKGYQWKS